MSKIYYLLQCEEDEYIIVKNTYCQRESNNTFSCTTTLNAVFRGSRIFEGGARQCQNHASSIKKKATVVDDSLLLPVNNPPNVSSQVF